jgi:hypothetical protein
VTGSGICSQYGFNDEVTPGTLVTVDHFVKHTSITGTGLDLITVDDEGLGGCAFVPTIDRTVKVGQQASFDVEHNLGTRGFGLILKQMLGSSAVPAQIAATAAYRQIHHNGDVAGKSLSVQFGFPETTGTGTVQPFTCNGCKITQWEISNARNDMAKLRYTIDGWDISTAIALATAVYPTSVVAPGLNEPLRWNCLSVKIGGTASLGSGLVSIAGGTEVAGCRGVSSKGVLPIRTDGFFSGGNGSKSEQLLAGDGFQEFTTELDLEFQSRTQVYDVHAAYSSFPLEVTWIGKTAIEGANFGKLSIIYPQAKLKTGTPNVNGPAGLEQKPTIKAYGDPAGILPAIQIEYISADTAL